MPSFLNNIIRDARPRMATAPRQEQIGAGVFNNVENFAVPSATMEFPREEVQTSGRYNSHLTEAGGNQVRPETTTKTGSSRNSATSLQEKSNASIPENNNSRTNAHTQNTKFSRIKAVADTPATQNQGIPQPTLSEPEAGRLVESRQRISHRIHDTVEKKNTSPAPQDHPALPQSRPTSANERKPDDNTVLQENRTARPTPAESERRGFGPAEVTPDETTSPHPLLAAIEVSKQPAIEKRDNKKHPPAKNIKAFETKSSRIPPQEETAGDVEMIPPQPEPLPLTTLDYFSAQHEAENYSASEKREEIYSTADHKHPEDTTNSSSSADTPQAGVHIGQIDIIIQTDAVNIAQPQERHTPSGNFSSRHYLRRLL